MEDIHIYMYIERHSTKEGGKSMLHYTQSCIILFEDSVKLSVYCKL